MRLATLIIQEYTDTSHIFIYSNAFCILLLGEIGVDINDNKSDIL